MHRLIAELTRLYFLPGQEWQSWQPNDNGEPAYVAEGTLTPEILAERIKAESNVALALVSPSGLVRSMVISFERGSYWEQLAVLYQGVQQDFHLPAPAISVSIEDGYQVWFSLAEPVPQEQAKMFLNALRLKYLAEIPLSRLKFRPCAEDDKKAESLRVLPLMTTLKKPTERWSAFIDPTMGSMFIDEPWLEMAPNLDKQAAMLADVESIKAEDFLRVLSIFQTDSAGAITTLESPAGSDGKVNQQSVEAHQVSLLLGVGSNFTDPKSFLMAVMNDQNISAHHRIEAAKALLPYFANLEVE